MTDIILIHPPINLSRWEAKLGSKLPPLGLASLAGYIRNKGISVKILDALNLGLSVDSVLDFIARDEPDYIGITATTNMINSAAMLAEEIKDRFPRITVIIGGAHVSALPEETIAQFPSFDAGVVGEGERTLLEIIDTGRIDRTIKGIIFRDGDTGAIRNEAREYIEDLDEIPFPAYDLLPGFPDFYRPTPNNYVHLPVAAVISSRGCPFNCTFCDRRVFGQRMRSCSVDYLIALLTHLQDVYGVKDVCFYDDIFLLNKKTLYEFMEKKEQSKLTVSWSCEGRVDQLDEQMLRDMKKAGCWQVNYGIESGSQTILDGFKKGIKVNQIKKTLIATRKAKLNARAYLIIGSPPETLRTLEETKKVILSVPLSDIHISFLTPLPGSELYKEITESLRVEDYKNINQYLISYVPPMLTRETLLNYMSELYRRFYL